MKPSIELTRAWFSYDPEAGTLTRELKHRDNIPDKVNMDRGRVYFFGVLYQVTHIIWVVYHGKWPDEFIDHIDHNRRNNRIENLREATRSQNCWNRIEDNGNGKGVTLRPEKIGRPWQAQIQYDNKKKHLGFFPTKEEAAEAYRQAAIQYHGEFACLI